MKQCRHRKLILIHAHDIYFTPDQEPYMSGKIECSGIAEVYADNLIAYFCPKCNVIVKFNTGDTDIRVTKCTGFTGYKCCNAH